MSSINPSLDAPVARGAAARALTLPVFAAAIFLSAFLLFSVQPLFTKMVLPVLGGTPAVWSVAMVFFQGVLLAGYLYAHLLNRYLGPGRAVLVHLAEEHDPREALQVLHAARPLQAFVEDARQPLELRVVRRLDAPLQKRRAHRH